MLGMLGRGGMGVVYKARQSKLRRLVALKMIRAGSQASAAELARFRTEAEAPARLQHPNVVQIYEVGEYERQPFLALEFVEGSSLASRLDGTPLPPRQASQLAQALAGAVHAAHQRGIVHRDLKPANVLLTTDGVPKITDFGLAKKLDEAAGLTGTGEIMGTPSYMAPEQTGQFVHPVGPATDVYALGAILYELLTGRAVFKGATPVDTVYQVVHQEPVPPRRLQPKVPRDLETICLKCLQKEPAKRYASARALADDLRHFLQGEPILARPIGRWERTVKWVRRRPASAALIAVTGLAAASLAVGAVWHEARLNAALKVAEEQRDKAQEHFQLARNAVDEMLTEVGEGWLKDIPETESVRQVLLQKALTFYQRFLQEQSENPQIQREVGKAYRRVGDIQQLLGHNAEAETAHQKSVETLAQLVKDSPGLSDYAWDLVASHQHLGRLYNAAGQLEQAEAAFRQALEIAETQTREHPEDLHRAPDLASSYSLLGRLCCNRGWVKPEVADAALHKAFALRERLASEHQAKADYQYELAESYDDLGVLYDITGRPDQATAVTQKAIDVKQELVRLSPGRTKYQSGLAGSYVNLGVIVTDQAKKEEAYGQALDIMEDLARKHPLVTRYQRDVGLISHNLGVCYRDTNRPEQAEAAYHKDVEVAEKLVRDHPKNTEYIVYLAGTVGNMGNILVHNRKPQAALDWYDRAIGLLEPIVQQVSPNARARRYLSNIHHDRATALAALGRHVDALQDCEQALKFTGDQTKGRVLYDMACIHCRASEAVRQDSSLVPAERDKQVEQHAAEAVNLLAQAHAAGYFKSAAALATAKKDKDLDPLRSRDDFKKLLSELEAKAGVVAK
jgi:serine/threonine-protein kinase